MEQETLEKIKFYLAKQGVKCEQLSTETTLQSFKMVTDEIEDFLTMYGNYYKIDFTGFKYSDYFVEDMSYSQFFKKLYNLFLYSSEIVEPNEKLPLTIGHLIKVAERRKWFKPEAACATVRTKTG